MTTTNQQREDDCDERHIEDLHTSAYKHQQHHSVGRRSELVSAGHVLAVSDDYLVVQVHLVVAGDVVSQGAIHDMGHNKTRKKEVRKTRQTEGSMNVNGVKDLMIILNLLYILPLCV